MSKSIGVFLVFVSWILSKEMYLSSLVEGNARCTSNKKNDFRPSEKKIQKITVTRDYVATCTPPPDVPPTAYFYYNSRFGSYFMGCSFPTLRIWDSGSNRLAVWNELLARPML